MVENLFFLIQNAISFMPFYCTQNFIFALCVLLLVSPLVLSLYEVKVVFLYRDPLKRWSGYHWNYIPNKNLCLHEEIDFIPFYILDYVSKILKSIVQNGW